MQGALETGELIVFEKVFSVGGIFKSPPSHSTLPPLWREAASSGDRLGKTLSLQVLESPCPAHFEGGRRRRVDGVEALTFDTVVGAVCCGPPWAALSPTHVPPVESPKQGQA